MPLGVAAATLGASAITAGGSAISTNRQNRKSRKWAEKQYERERADNIELWHMQNEYNSPEKQVQRMKAGNLNPALMYGSGTTGGGVAAPIKSPDIKTPQFQSNDFSGVASGVQNAINQHYDTRIKKAQTDNLKAQNTVMKQEALLKNAQIQNTGVQTKRSKHDLSVAKQYSADAARLINREKQVNIESTTSDTDRKNALHSSNMEEAALRIIRSKTGNKLDKEKIKETIESTQLKKQERELAEDGIFKNDPMWMRILSKNIDSILEKYGWILKN